MSLNGISINDIPKNVADLITSLRSRRQFAYRLRWRGTKVPRGAQLDGSPISWTQHGCVYTNASAGTIVGYYTRVAEFAGASGDEHEMIISTDFTVEAGPGQQADLIRDMPLAMPENE
jgi:hypothetical protein